MSGEGASPARPGAAPSNFRQRVVDLCAEFGRLHPTRGVYTEAEAFKWAQRFAALADEMLEALRASPPPALSEEATWRAVERLWCQALLPEGAEVIQRVTTRALALRASPPPGTRAAPCGSRRVYVAASWRTPMQPAVVARLRAEGFEVYDFRNPAPPFTRPESAIEGFAWSEIDPDWQQWDSREYVAALAHPLAVRGFRTDMDALRLADTVVLVQPSGRSAALELGWSSGAGKRTAVLLAEGQEPELMLRMADLLTPSLDELVGWLRAHRLPGTRAASEEGA